MNATRVPAPRAVLFDLDGTLVDSVPDLAGSLNVLLERRGLPPLALDEVRAMVGDGIEKLVERAFAARGEDPARAMATGAYGEMIEIYGGRLSEETTLMPGALETLEALRLAGVLLAVVTNKAQSATDAILVDFGLMPFLDAVVGGDRGHAKKPAPDIPLAALARLGITPAEAVLVGDGPADVGAARAAGLPVILVRGGYTTIPVEALEGDLVIAGLAELGGALDSLLPSARQA